MKSVRRFGVAALAAAALMLATAACSVSTDDGATAPAAAGAKVKIGFSQVTQQSPFYVELGNGAKAAAAKAGYELLFVDANGDVTKQNNDVQDLITRGINVLIINPVDPKGVAPAIAAAKAAGIKVVTVDRPVATGAAAHIGRDNVKMGQLVGEQMVKTLGPEGGAVLEIQGDAGGIVAKDRHDGFHKAAAVNPKIKIVEGPYANYIRVQAVTAMQDLLQAHPEVKAVYAHNDDMAIGALQVLNESGRKDVKVFGVDGLMESVKAIATGDQYVATAFNDPIGLGAKTIEVASQVAEGKKVPSFVDAGTGLIDKANASTLVGSTLFAQRPAR